MKKYKKRNRKNSIIRVAVPAVILCAAVLTGVAYFAVRGGNDVKGSPSQQTSTPSGMFEGSSGAVSAPSSQPADSSSRPGAGAELSDARPADAAQETAPTYIGGILVVNKTYSLPADYNPGVDSTAKAALDTMFADAKDEGVSLYVVSGFRSYQRQSTIYNQYVKRDGQEAADRYSARPGHSEHQSGLAFDLNDLSESFGRTKEGIWLRENCWKYGFIIRYPEDKESITGYMYEPWHVRYIGNDSAKAVYESGLCLEEYLGITSQYS